MIQFCALNTISHLALFFVLFGGALGFQAFVIFRVQTTKTAPRTFTLVWATCLLIVVAVAIFKDRFGEFVDPQCVSHPNPLIKI